MAIDQQKKDITVVRLGSMDLPKSVGSGAGRPESEVRLRKAGESFLIRRREVQCFFESLYRVGVIRFFCEPRPGFDKGISRLIGLAFAEVRGSESKLDCGVGRI
jgi:hypothetical protein